MGVWFPLAVFFMHLDSPFAKVQAAPIACDSVLASSSSTLLSPIPIPHSLVVSLSFILTFILCFLGTLFVTFRGLSPSNLDSLGTFCRGLVSPPPHACLPPRFSAPVLIAALLFVPGWDEKPGIRRKSETMGV